jgi:DNA gyrase subunit A
MLFAFENGKAAKIELESYATKTNRRKLANAYCSMSRLVYITYLDQDIELVAYSSISKVLIFNTSAIGSKSARNSQGIQVMKGKKGSVVTGMRTVEESGIVDLNYYRTKNIPAVGCYLKDEDSGIKQVQLEI